MNKILKVIGILILAISLSLSAVYILGDKKTTVNTNYVSNLVNRVGNEQHDLPIVVINTNGQKLEYNGKDQDNSEKVTVDIEIYDSGTSNSLVDAPVLQEKAKIGIRGNTTRSLPKKQYSITFIDENNNEIEKEVLGMTKASKWILNASFEDKSLMRNYLVYSIGKNIVASTPKVKYCEVYYIDDDSKAISKDNYVGIYLMTDKIGRGEDRVNISQTIKNKSETSFILAKNNARVGDSIIHNYGLETYLYDYNVIIQYPKNDLTEAKKNYINQSLSEFERSLYSDYFDDEKNGYAKYIDVDSFVDYYIINEFFKNTDCGTFSTYIYKDFGEKIKAGPIWDFDNAVGNSESVGEYYDPTGFYMANSAWFDVLVKDKNFVDKVITRYKSLRSTYLSEKYIMDMIDDTNRYIYRTQIKNFEVWPIDICNQAEMFKNYYGLLRTYGRDIDKIRSFIDENPSYIVDDSKLAKTYDEEISKLKTFISERGKWIDENIDSLKKICLEK